MTKPLTAVAEQIDAVREDLNALAASSATLPGHVVLAMDHLASAAFRLRRALDLPHGPGGLPAATPVEKIPVRLNRVENRLADIEMHDPAGLRKRLEGVESRLADAATKSDCHALADRIAELERKMPVVNVTAER